MTQQFKPKSPDGKFRKLTAAEKVSAHVVKVNELATKRRAAQQASAPFVYNLDEASGEYVKEARLPQPGIYTSPLNSPEKVSWQTYMSLTDPNPPIVDYGGREALTDPNPNLDQNLTDFKRDNFPQAAISKPTADHPAFATDPAPPWVKPRTQPLEYDKPSLGSLLADHWGWVLVAVLMLVGLIAYLTH
jgi:hypothetical protein